MNNWNFNELTQEDQFDFKACQRKDKSIYGVPDKSACVQGKELTRADLDALGKAANNGDKQAKAQMEAYNKVRKADEKKARDEKNKKKAAEKAAAGGKKGKGKKGGGKGKKGGKGKGGKGAKGKNPAASTKGNPAQMSANAKKAQAQAASNRQKRAKEIRARVSELQKTIRTIKNPELRKMLEQQISDALRTVSDIQSKAPGGEVKPPAPPAAKPPAKA